MHQNNKDSQARLNPAICRQGQGRTSIRLPIISCLATIARQPRKIRWSKGSTSGSGAVAAVPTSTTYQPVAQSDPAPTIWATVSACIRLLLAEPTGANQRDLYIKINIKKESKMCLDLAPMRRKRWITNTDWGQYLKVNLRVHSFRS